MCGESAFILYYPGGHRHLDDIDIMEIDGNQIRLMDMKGGESLIAGRIRTIDLVNRRIEVVA
ncbi:MAG: CooT family nickel-binding protein [bacterium]|nr:MAG: CooT family nickel-binding protein [bacterium]